MINHDGKSEDIDSEDRGKELQVKDNPFFSIRIIAFSDGIVAKEESSSDDSVPVVIHTFFTFFDIFRSWVTHGAPPYSMSNGKLGK
jgi:hypothetical protein